MAKIKKQYQKNFTTIDNSVLKDERLSWKAKGLFIYLWSKPDNWDYKASEVTNHSTDGLASTSSGLKELETYGYLKRTQNNENGCFGGSVWILSETPNSENRVSDKDNSENPISENPKSDNASSENRKLLNTDITNKRITNKRVTKTPTTTPTKQNNATNVTGGSGNYNHSREDVNNYWQSTWGVVGPIVQQDVNEWINQFGPDVMYYSIDYAKSKEVSPRGARGFFNKLTKSYAEKHVITVEDAIRVNQEFDNQAKSYQRGNNGHKHVQELLPAWFIEQREQEKQGQFKPNSNPTDRIPKVSEVPMPDD